MKPPEQNDSLITDNQDPQQNNVELMEIERNQEILAKQTFLVREVELLNRSGFNAIDISRIRVKLDEIADKRGIDAATARKVFLQDLESYDAMVGFRGKLDRAKSNEDVSAEKIVELEDQLSELEREYNRKKASLDALSSLHEKGVGEEELLQVRTALESSGTNIENLIQQIRELGNLAKKIESLRTEEQKLDERVAQLRAELKELSSNHSQLQSSVSLLNSQILSKMAEIRGTADAFVDDAKNKIAALSEEMRKKVGAVDLSGMSRRLETLIEDMRKRLESIDLGEADQQLATLMEEMKKRVEQTSKEIVQIADTAAKEAVEKETRATDILSKQAILGLDAVHQDALRACKKYLGEAYETAPTEKKVECIMHYESLLALLRKQKS